MEGSVVTQSWMAAVLTGEIIIVPYKHPKPRVPVIPTRVERDRKKNPLRQPKHPKTEGDAA